MNTLPPSQPLDYEIREPEPKPDSVDAAIWIGKIIVLLVFGAMVYEVAAVVWAVIE